MSKLNFGLLYIGLVCVAFFSFGTHPKYVWDDDKWTAWVQSEYYRFKKKRLSTWDAFKISLAVRTFAPPDRVGLVHANLAVESEYENGVPGDDGKSLGLGQVQADTARSHELQVDIQKLRWDISTNIKWSVRILKNAGWDPQAYNAGGNGAKKGRGWFHLRKVLKQVERQEQHGLY